MSSPQSVNLPVKVVLVEDKPEVRDNWTKLINSLEGFSCVQTCVSGENALLGCLVPIGWVYYGAFQSPPKGGSQGIPLWLQHVVEYYKNQVVLQ